MRILAFSDIRGNHRIYRRIVSLAQQHPVDAVVLAGDLLDVPPGHEVIEGGPLPPESVPFS
jgi:predicted phosphodiesterase